ncbi:MAG: helix-turn-helix transcriptional regulator [Burkholderiales bacterium]|nr:helix-turn-helix transcriptional regulator [Burkholderiales bacterium]MDP2399356.1 helix-turn-helix transcriptional regulator [Burkholderiales bacterium]
MTSDKYLLKIVAMSTKHFALDTLKKPVDSDWHKADIIAAIHKQGTSLQRIARLRCYFPTSLHAALHRPYPKAERIIAETLGVEPQVIWPSRYHADGTPKSGRGQRGLGRYKTKDSTAANSVNVHERKVA